MEHTCKFKKRDSGHCISRRPRRKHRIDQHHKLNRKNHENFIKQQKTLDDTIRFQYDPAGKVIKHSTKKLCTLLNFSTRI